MVKKIALTSSEARAFRKVYDVSSPALADEIVAYTVIEAKADEIVYFTAFEARADKKVYIMNPDLYINAYRKGVDSGQYYDPPESETVEVWLRWGESMRDQEKYALARECFSKALVLDPHNQTARSERDRLDALLERHYSGQDVFRVEDASDPDLPPH